jgi:hypothetical protein
MPPQADLDAIHAAATLGDDIRFRQLFNTATSTYGLEAFALANQANINGLTPLHASASRGHIRIVQWRAFSLYFFFWLLQL